MLRRFGLALLLAVGAPALLSAQYFGQNKVQYSHFDFQVLRTEHFDIYYYEEERQAALDAARMAERAYARLSRILNHRFKERKPIILYASHSDFQQTNATPGEIGEGTGGFTDFLKHRNVMPLTGSYTEIEEVLTHEMVHQFQYDIWARGRAGAGLQTIIAVNPPLWFVEGMAAYLSRGPADPETSMWMRDAALEGELPSLEQLAGDPRVFPYRFGQGVMSYIGERWGDEAIGAILHGTLTGGLESSVRRTLGVTLPQLSDQWRDAVQRKYLPEIGRRVKPDAIARPVLTEEKSDGTLHLAPALSPDGSKVAFFSEKDFFFVDLYLADVETGKVRRRLFQSTYNGDYETYRFLNSAASFSPDGRRLALAAKRGGRDEIVVLDVDRNRVLERIKLDLNGASTPAWSPDGKRLVFTGYDGGLSDLFVVNADGTGLERLTDDRYADLHPVWSPDGRTIAFTTDRGPDTDFETLAFGNLRIGLYDLASRQVTLLQNMDAGRNINPQWSPDGRTLAYVSDRTGVPNVFLQEVAGATTWQLTDFYSGVHGITSLSPVLSWARDADRLAFVYYEKGQHDVYVLDDPRSLAREPWRPAGEWPPVMALTTTAPDEEAREIPAATLAAAAAVPQVGSGGSIYRSPDGFRVADSVTPPTATAQSDSAPPRLLEPVSVAALMDSVSLALPDTGAFEHVPYRIRFSPDYVARPSIGYARDTFGRGIFGGSAIALSDILGNHQLVFAGYVNGRISEAQVLAAYANLSRRLNWAAGVSQDPYFYLEPYEIRSNGGESEFITNIRRLVIRSVFGQASYPLSRFQRVEAGMRFANVGDTRLSIVEPFDPSTGYVTDDPYLEEDNLPGASFIQPSLALVFDNALGGYVGPLYGRRSRFEIAQTVGTWSFTQLTGDYRRYDQLPGPFVLATRVLYYGRVGRDAGEFPIFLGTPDLLRGHTSGSFRRNECFEAADAGTETGCAELDRLIGSQIGVASAEIRFPLINASLTSLPLNFPPVEGVLFWDVGMAWNSGNTLAWTRDPGDDPVNVRTPLQTLGAGIRTNLFGVIIARLDYSVPQNRRAVDGYWTISLGPAF
ncbi:MAG: BamA/TamA family outer membrane protein [Gemmatimonadota bacterium]|nr:BamA/TamA family outer membrane protein [Gemmatimonadota bacterium]